MSLTQQDTRHIYKLSRIEASDNEVANSTVQLNGIFDFIQQLQDVNTDGVMPMAGVGGYNLRINDDIVSDGDKRDAVLKNAPRAEFGCFVVPKMVD